MNETAAERLRRKIGPGFMERKKLAEAAWAEYREVNPFPLPETMPAQFHAGFTLGCAEMEERIGEG